MALTPANLSASILGGLTTVGLKGSAVSQLAQGLANGLTAWTQGLTVVTTDTGSAGVGAGFLPWLVPLPLLSASLLATYPANGHLGPFAPVEAQGMAIGLSLGFAQGFLVTVHAGVGAGTGFARVTGGPAFPFLIAGLLSVGVKGTGASQKANAISQALTLVLQTFGTPIPIVGSASPVVTAGVGVGRIS
jgi:hypothetical protein